MKQKFEKVSNDEEELVEFENTFGCEVREFQVLRKKWGPYTIVITN